MILCGKNWEQNNFCQCFSFFCGGAHMIILYIFLIKKIEVNWKHSLFSKLVTQYKLQNLLHLLKWLTSIWILFAYHLILYQYARKCNFVLKSTIKDFYILRFLNILVRWKICLDECIYIWFINCIFIVWTRNCHFWKYPY